MHQSSNPEFNNININIDLPVVYFHLYNLPFDPISQAIELALKHKNQYYSKMNVKVCNLHADLTEYKRLLSEDEQLKEHKKANPHKVQLPTVLSYINNNIDSRIWTTNIQDIFASFDNLLPANSLLNACYPNNDNIQLQLAHAQFCQWLIKTFDSIYWILLFGNNKGILQSERQPASKIVNLMNPVYKFLRNKMRHAFVSYTSKNNAYIHAVRSLQSEYLPLLEHYIESMQSVNNKYLFGDNLLASDILIYSYIKCFQQLEEKDIIRDYPHINTLVNNIKHLDTKEFNNYSHINTKKRNYIPL